VQTATDGGGAGQGANGLDGVMTCMSDFNRAQARVKEVLDG
jgi:hypothetical protein